MIAWPARRDPPRSISLCLLVASVILTAIMMQPSLTTVLVVGANAGLLLLMRFTAHREGCGR